MYKSLKFIILSIFVGFMFASCDGSGSDSSQSSAVATGAPLSNADVTIKDSTGEVIVSGIKTDDFGKFLVQESQLSSKSPFFLKAEKSTSGGLTEKLYSIFTISMLRDGLKVTPISSMVVAFALPQGTSLEDGFDSFGTTVKVDEKMLEDSIESSFKLIEPLLKSRNIESKDHHSLMSGSFVSDGTGLDALLEVIDFDVDGDFVTIKPKSDFLESKSGLMEIDASIDALEKKLADMDDNNDNPIEKMAKETKNEMPTVVIFTSTSSWGKGQSWAGYHGKIYIINGSSQRIDGWRLDFISENFKQSGVWDTDKVIDQQTPIKNGYSFKNLSYNASVNKKDKISFGYNGVGDFKNIVGDIKDAKLNGKPVLVKYFLDGIPQDEVDPSYVANGFFTDIKDENNQSMEEKLEEELEKDKKDINTTQIEEEHEDGYVDDDTPYVLLFETTDSTSGDFGAALTVTNPQSRYKHTLKLTMQKPTGVTILPNQGCYGTGECSIKLTNGRLIITMKPWNSEPFNGNIDIRFRAGGALTNDVLAATIYNDDNIAQATKVVYKNYLTLESYEEYLRELAKNAQQLAEGDNTPEQEKEEPIEHEDFFTQNIIDHSNSQHFAVGYIPSWKLTWSNDDPNSALFGGKAKVAQTPVMDYLIVSFVSPDLTAKWNGLENTSPGFKNSIEALQNRGVKVLLAVGGATYNNWKPLIDEQGMTIQESVHKKALRDLIIEYGYDGLDVDYEVEESTTQEYKKAVLAMREVIDSINEDNSAANKILSLAAWSTGADCTASSPTGIVRDNNDSTYGLCDGRISYWGGRASRERALFRELKKSKDLEDIFDFISVMSYDGKINRFDPITLYKNYRELYKGPMALGLQVAAEGWVGAELVIAHEDAQDCSNSSMTKGDSYDANIDANASYSIERFANFLKNEADGNSDIKNGFMLWTVMKQRSNYQCARATSNKEAIIAIDEYLFKNTADKNRLSDIRQKLEDSSVTSAGGGSSQLPPPDNSDDGAKSSVEQLTTEEYLAIEKSIIEKDLLLTKSISSMRTFRDFDYSSSWPISTVYEGKGELPNFEVNSTLPANVQRVKRIFSESDWEFIFPLADIMHAGSGAKVSKNYGDASTYTYKNFLNAVAFYPNFCNEAWSDDGSLIADTDELDKICKIELSTMFAHFAQEVGAHDGVFAGANSVFPASYVDENGIGIPKENEALLYTPEIPEWRQGLFHVIEWGCSETDPAGCQYRECNMFECADGAKYFGRGAKQLSYNFNYIPFSQTILGDGDILKNHPDLVAKDGRLALLSAFYFYMTSRSPKPSIHHVVAGSWKPNAKDLEEGRELGFGVTIDIVNGGVECGGSDDIAQGKNRVKYYTAFRDYFDIPVKIDGNNFVYDYALHSDDSKLGCAKLKNFAAGGSASAPSYWERHWTEDGKCKLVSYETKYSAFREGEYGQCVVEHFFK